jgi:hypothetical protein
LHAYQRRASIPRRRVPATQGVDNRAIASGAVEADALAKGAVDRHWTARVQNQSGQQIELTVVAFCLER